MKLIGLNFRAYLAVSALLLPLATASRLASALPTHNVPQAVAVAHDEGRVDGGKEMNLTVVLNLHNRAEFDKAVEELYDPASNTFHEWFTEKDFAKYAPTEEEFETVKSELVRQGFSVLSSDPRRFSIRVHGTAAVVEKAFQTELHTFTYNGRSFQAHIRDAQLAGRAGELIEAVAGIEQHQARPQLSVVKNPKTGLPYVKKPLTTKADLTAFKNSLTDAPLSVAGQELWATGNIGAYYDGLEYGANGQTGALTPAQLQAHYGIPFTQNKVKYDGTGETIALVEGYGYPTAEADANAAASLFGLPALTAANFSVVYPEGKPLNPNAGILTGWNTEIALDIQSAHAIAPGAQILVVASSGQDDEDLIQSLNYVIAPSKGATPLAFAVSSSWETDSEFEAGSLEEGAFTTVLESGVAAGISFQFSSGDGGDDGFGTPVGSVEVPANSPYATAVGGTSILNNPYGSGQIVTGWGNDEVYVYDFGVEDPGEGFYFGGAGGGQSQYFAKPAWQNSLPGTWRLVPDVSALADPWTGFPTVVTSNGTQYGYVIGGTSLASPIFTATWAVAGQYNGKPLGFAPPLLSKLTASDITDVVPPPASITQYDTVGLIEDSTGLHSETAVQVFTRAIDEFDYPNLLSLDGTTDFVSALYPNSFGSSFDDLVISFGTDSSLTVTKGWDNVTGWGEPNGLPFIQGVTGKTTGAKPAKK